jgi:hypothetical protein
MILLYVDAVSCARSSSLCDRSFPQVTIKTLAAGIEAVIAKQLGKIKLHIQVGLVSYKDFGEGPIVTPFTRDENLLGQALAALVANCRGGHDVAEDVASALMCAANVQWQSKARFCILITDAPGHYDLNLGRDPFNIPFDAPDRPNLDWRAPLAALHGKNVNLLLATLAPQSTDHMARQFQTVYVETPDSVTSFKYIHLLERDVAMATFHYIFVLDESGSSEFRDRPCYRTEAYTFRSGWGLERRHPRDAQLD